MKSNLTIFGTGALASIFAARLSSVAGVNLSLFGSWRQQVNALQTAPLKVTNVDGSCSLHEIRATNQIYDLPPIDIAIVLVKSFQTRTAARRISEVLKPEGIALTLQNGLGNVEILEKQLGHNRVLGGVTNAGATMLCPGHVKHTAEGVIYIAGKSKMQADMFNLIQVLDKADFRSEISESAESIIWGKLVLNAGINPMTALLEVKNGELVENPLYLHVLEKIVDEAEAVANAQGIELPYSNGKEEIVRVCKMTATNCSSMFQDILRKSQTEIEFINGAICKIGEKYGLDMTLNRFLVEKIKQKEIGIKFNEAELENLI